jgi:hypothetical protein
MPAGASESTGSSDRVILWPVVSSTAYLVDGSEVKPPSVSAAVIQAIAVPYQFAASPSVDEAVTALTAGPLGRVGASAGAVEMVGCVMPLASVEA